MTKIEERMMEIEKKQSFWKGFVSGIGFTVACITGAITAGYYLLEILK